MRTSIVLIDGENVQLSRLEPLDGLFKVKIFLGSHQRKLPLQTVRAVQALGDDAEYIDIKGNGKNALDFHIAYYIGRLSEANPDACFSVISGDTGFDVLIEHLKEKNICCARFTSFDEVALHGRVQAVLENLASRKDAKPRTVKTLRNTIKALLARIDEQGLDALLAHLMSRGDITVDGGKVEYRLAA